MKIKIIATIELTLIFLSGYFLASQKIIEGSVFLILGLIIAVITGEMIKNKAQKEFKNGL